MDDTLIKQLAIARQSRQSIKDGISMLTKALYESKEYKDLVTSLQMVMEIEASVLAEVEKVSRAEFEANKENKHPHPTITFQSKTDVTLLAEDELRDWVIHNFTPALAVDDSVVKKAALEKKIPAKFFTATPYDKFTIATDLSSFIPKEEPTVI
jgi:hypothetical protein